MIYELHISHIAKPVEPDPDPDHEVVLRPRPEDALHLLVDGQVFVGAHLVLGVHLLLAHAADLLSSFGDEAESLIEWVVFLPLIHDLLDAVLVAVLVDHHLKFQARIVFVGADLDFGEVADLGYDGVLLEATEHSDLEGLKFLVSLGAECLVVWVLHVSNCLLLPQHNLLRLPQVVNIDPRQSLLKLHKLVDMRRNLLPMRLIDGPQLQLLLASLLHQLLLHFLDFFLI